MIDAPYQARRFRWAFLRSGHGHEGNKPWNPDRS